MNWVIDFLPEAIQDMNDLDGSQRKYVIKALKKMQDSPLNPLLQSNGGYGESFGYKNDIDLSELLKIKIKTVSLCIVYKLIIDSEKMLFLVIRIR